MIAQQADRRLCEGVGVVGLLGEFQHVHRAPLGEEPLFSFNAAVFQLYVSFWY